MSQTPKILIVNTETNVEELRDMSPEELEEYNSVLSDAEVFMTKHSEDVVKKEAAIAKLVALGLSEEEIRAMGI
jgi:hypothetical protein